MSSVVSVISFIEKENPESCIAFSCHILILQSGILPEPFFFFSFLLFSFFWVFLDADIFEIFRVILKHLSVWGCVMLPHDF